MSWDLKVKKGLVLVEVWFWNILGLLWLVGGRDWGGVGFVALGRSLYFFCIVVMRLVFLERISMEVVWLVRWVVRGVR